MVVVLVVVGAALSTVIGVSSPACACSCATRSAERVLADAPAALVGRVVDVADHGTGGHRYRIEVQRSFKKALPQTISVVSGQSGGGCGMGYEVGREYFIVLGGSSAGVVPADGEWSASLCSNLSVREADAQRLAGPALAPIADATTPPSSDADGGIATGLWWGVAGGAALVVAAALVLMLRRRRG